MLDIIIPSYNDLQGLYNSLSSIGFNFNPDKLQITIIDDCSTMITKQDYEKILSHYYYLPIKIHYCTINQGPGIARNIGLNITKKPYVIFLDCGDLFYSPLTIQRVFNILNINPGLELLEQRVVQYYSQEQIDINTYNFFIENKSNCFHGKVIARCLLGKIKMPITDPYHHEDIPYIVACRAKAHYQNTVLHLEEEPIVIRTINPTSLTANLSDFYQHCLISMAQNTIEILNHNIFTEDERIFIIYHIMLSLACMIISPDVEIENEQYLLTTQQLEVVQQFYFNYYKPIHNANKTLYLTLYQHYMISIFEHDCHNRECIGSIPLVYQLLESDQLDKLKQIENDENNI